MITAIVAVGSNIEPEESVEKTIALLKRDFAFVYASDFIRTEPEGFKDQPDFLNGAICIRTTFNRQELEKYLKEAEVKLGRVKGPNKAGPRVIDLDLVIWDGAVVHDDYYSKDYTSIPVNQLLRELNMTV
ncbi:MAG: 2-amino-4-hydroxy-6-hydroxymethyldihydropteridine diphosphokinase [Spirochaetaceae bacterium]|nr:2-amino-4-hydroxy-6-hydroxymethyldihydropteridine diphosphokinase [Spirochaetaceae bacterium]|tara:strand:+ start:505 stop:894 length:390 start_codon:yes stop_codon:yes gene_type:complete